MLKMNQKLFRNFMEFRGKQGQFTWDANEKSKIKNKKEEKDDLKRKQAI